MIDVPRETRHLLDRLRELVIAENERQNLISKTTIDDIEMRHIADSIQLLPHLPRGELVDVGTGAGFPGLVLACFRDDLTHLVEPRAKRAEFLKVAVEQLGLPSVTVWQSKVEDIPVRRAAAITARAVASLDALFAAAEAVADVKTRWVLPKGRQAQSELDTARLSWQGSFELIPSATDPASWIVLADGVHRRRKA